MLYHGVTANAINGGHPLRHYTNGINGLSAKHAIAHSLPHNLKTL